jgi:FkbM family methyltransferase
MTNETIWNSLHGLEEHFLHTEEKRMEKKFIESINVKGFNCLDIGFNYGWWSWILLQNIGKKGKVYAWEPSKFLYENYLAKWPFKNIIGYDYALSDKTGIQDFYVYSDKGFGSGLNSLEKENAGEEETPKEIRKVQTKTLDDWWNENGGPNINLIKVDCEGHDFKILQGGKQLIKITQPEFIIVEQKNALLSNFMQELNYTKIHNEIGLIDSVWKLT